MFLKSPIITARHGFFTRELNCGYGHGESDEIITANRERALKEIGGEVLVTAKQIHSATALVVNGAGNYQADALVTNKPGIALGIYTADCVPILLEDKENGIIGAAHAGWQGARFGVIDSAVRAMRNLGAEEITAAIGPCIQQKSYEVSEEFLQNFLAESAGNKEFFINGRAGHYMFDLPGYVERKLQNNGVQQIDNLKQDTLSQPEKFFSYRRKTLGDSSYGSQISVICL